MKKDLFDLSAEVSGVAMVILGLSNQLDSDRTNTLNAESMQSALFGVACYLERISDDLIMYEEAATCRK